MCGKENLVPTRDMLVVE